MTSLIRGCARSRSLFVLTLFVLVLPPASQSQAIEYRLKYSGHGDQRVAITISVPEAIPLPIDFIVPRNYPGGYNLVLYDSFVENMHALSPEEKPLRVAKHADGPRWTIGEYGEKLRRVEYQVDIGRMEVDLAAAIDSSKARPHYLGVLGYSVFGYIEGLQDRKIQLRVEGPEEWPVLTTLSPSVPASKNAVSAVADNYYTLADSQILMGPDLQVRLIKGKSDLYLAAYVEVQEDLALEGQLAREALDEVENYFGNSPFPEYTVQLELLHPRPGHDYGFSQEHLNSGTFSFATTRAITARSTAEQRQTRLFNYAHHMAHCWIPKRAYGIGYLPFAWEMPPVIDTIWFNEGFARYAAIEAVAEAMPSAEGAAFRTKELSGLRKILDGAPPFIREMPLLVLSREASFMYSLDFRIGMNTFARGALMAADTDDRIRSRSNGNKSLRDGLRYLLEWTVKNPRAFKTEELGPLLSQSTSVDVSDILERWMKPNPQ
jgi:predicted metalloprotease with PDZ domain